MTRTRAKKKPSRSKRKPFKEIETQWRMMASNFQEIKAGMQKLKKIMTSCDTVKEQKKKNERNPYKRKNNVKQALETDDSNEICLEPMRKRIRNNVDETVSNFPSSLKTIYKNPKYIPSSESIPAPIVSHNTPDEVQTNISVDSTVYRVTDNDWTNLPTLMAQITSSSSKIENNHFEETFFSEKSEALKGVPVTHVGELPTDNLLHRRMLMHMGDSLAITSADNESHVNYNIEEGRNQLNPADGCTSVKVSKKLKSPKSALSYHLVGNLLKNSKRCNNLQNLRNSMNIYINKTKHNLNDDLVELPNPTSSQERSVNVISSTKGKTLYHKAKNASEMTSKEQNEMARAPMARHDTSPLQNDLSAKYCFDSEYSKNSRYAVQYECRVKHEKQNYCRDLVPVGKGRKKLLPYVFFFVISYFLTSIMYVA